MSLTLGALPDEVLLHILAQLPLIEILRAAELSSKWKALARDDHLWKLLYFSYWGPFTSNISKIIADGLPFLDLFKERYLAELNMKKNRCQGFHKRRNFIKTETKQKKLRPTFLLLLFEEYKAVKIVDDVTFYSLDEISKDSFFLDIVDLGIILCQHGGDIYLDKAEQVLKMAIDMKDELRTCSMNTNNISCAFIMRGSIAMQKGETEKADEFFTEAEKLLSSLPDENQQKDFNLGCVYSLWRKFEQCRIALERCLERGYLRHDYMEEEPDFNNVREFAWFKDLQERARKAHHHQQHDIALPWAGDDDGDEEGEEEVQPMLPPEFEGHEAIEAAENGEEEGEQE